MWVSYESTRKHPQDFDVKYKLFSVSEGGRKRTFQGLRCDFAYQEDKIEDGIYCIHPEFEDAKGNIIKNTEIPVPIVGIARMWILSNEGRNSLHKKKIRVGVKGYMMEGARKIGEVEVIKIVGLYSNS